MRMSFHLWSIKIYFEKHLWFLPCWLQCQVHQKFLATPVSPKKQLNAKIISKHAASVLFSILRLQEALYRYSNLVVVFWESVSIGAGHVTPVAITLAFKASLQIQYSPLLPTNIHPCMQPWIVIPSRRHPPIPMSSLATTPGPGIATDWVELGVVFLAAAGE